MKVGLVGCGHIAAIHIQAIRAVDGAEIVGVADAFEDYAGAFAAQFGVPRVFNSATRLIEETRPDVVHVLTPPVTHCRVALECLERGCHVLVEKPMTLDVSEAEQMIEAAKRYGVLLAVDHNCRFEPVVRRAAEILASGRLGELVTIEVDFGYNISRYPAMIQAGAENSHWAYKLNGGPLQDQMPHPVSLILEHVDTVKDLLVFSKNRGILPAPWADEIRVVVDAEPAHAEIYISFSLRPDAMVLTLRGTQGTVCADMGSMIASVEGSTVLPRAVARGLAGFSRSRQNLQGAVGNIFKVATGKFDTTNGVKHVVAGFYAAIAQGTVPPVTMEEGKRVVEFIQKIWPEPVRKAVSTPQADVLQNPLPHIKARPHPTTLVTGASGFIGSHLVQRLLRDGVPVRAFVRPSSYGLGLLQGMDVEIVQGDLANPHAVREATRGIETVFHVGAPMRGDWERHRHSTVGGTQNVIEAAIEAQVRRVVHVSSLVVYQVIGASNGQVMDEDWPYENKADKLGAYTRAKIAAEKLAFAAHAKQGLAISIVRPGIVIGPRGPVFFPHLGYKLQDKVFVVLGSGKGILPLVYVDNLVDGMMRCANNDKAIGNAYNFVDDGSITVLDYLHRFIQETRIPSKIIQVPYALPYCATGGYELAAGLGVVKKGATSRLQLNWKHKSLHFRVSSERAKKDLGWSSEVGMDEALRRTFQWYTGTKR
jgi:predicted dehydrogenase/nucleoside-diphosphate-sugar epimerase